jgi:hypothetical protein
MQKTISLFLILLVSITNLVALCSNEHGQIADVHLVYDECDPHACNESQTCDTRQCDHGFSKDENIATNRIQRFDDYVKIFSISVNGSFILENNEPRVYQYRKNVSIYSVPQKRYLQVLRI